MTTQELLKALNTARDYMKERNPDNSIDLSLAISYLKQGRTSLSVLTIAMNGLREAIVAISRDKNSKVDLQDLELTYFNMESLNVEIK